MQSHLILPNKKIVESHNKKLTTQQLQSQSYLLDPIEAKGAD